MRGGTEAMSGSAGDSAAVSWAMAAVATVVAATAAMARRRSKRRNNPSLSGTHVEQRDNRIVGPAGRHRKHLPHIFRKVTQ
ncbi:hypothetical protein GCM10009099_34850 [Caenispirillum bisanense]